MTFIFDEKISREKLHDQLNDIMAMSVSTSVALMELAEHMDRLLVLISAMNTTIMEIARKGKIMSHEQVDSLLQRAYHEIISGNVKMDMSHLKIITEIMESHTQTNEMLRDRNVGIA